MINELIEKINAIDLKANENMSYYFKEGVSRCINIVRSLLPAETPEKIAEMKAVEMVENKLGQASGFYNDTDKEHVKQMLIEAYLTDIKK